MIHTIRHERTDASEIARACSFRSPPRKLPYIRREGTTRATVFRVICLHSTALVEVLAKNYLLGTIPTTQDEPPAGSAGAPRLRSLYVRLLGAGMGTTAEH
eukprot:1147018-Prorocentrum_minimum.AAC.3